MLLHLIPFQNNDSNNKNQDHTGQQQQVLHLNWSNFKPEFSGQPHEDTEAHLLHSNDWMNAHHFVEGVKVRDFVLHY